jgi:hypothetical protein
VVGRARQVRLAKRSTLLGLARHEQDVALADEGVGRGVGEGLVAGLDAHHGDVVLGPEAGLEQRLAVRLLGCQRLDQGEALVELDVVDHAAGDHVRHPHAHVVLGEHDGVGADSAEDASVGLGDGLGPDVGDLEVVERRGGEDAGLDVAADAHDRGLEVGGPELAQRGDVGGVGLDDVSEGARHLLDHARVGVDAEDLVAEVLEGLAERAAEAAEADDEHFVPGAR